MVLVFFCVSAKRSLKGPPRDRQGSLWDRTGLGFGGFRLVLFEGLFSHGVCIRAPGRTLPRDSNIP